MTTERREAEAAIVQDALASKPARIDQNGIVPPRDIEEIRRRIERANALSSSSPLRIGTKLAKETDPELN
ncbi:MAG: hypothetical protein WC651_00580 [Candidatus Gracilibacteria bacterium]|jgi:hypothetical protein